MFWPLAAYAGATLVAPLFSVDPRTSASSTPSSCCSSPSSRSPTGCCRGRRALTVVDVIITVGALSAVVGIVQFGILKFDNLGQRPQGALGLYMTYSGQLMLVACTAAARIMFRKHDRVWAALVLPALLVALVDHVQPQRLGRRLRRHRPAVPDAGLPAGRAAAGRGGAVPRLRAGAADRAASTRRSASTSSGTTAPRPSRACSRTGTGCAMMKSGLRIIKDHPLTGVGPDMVIQVYPHYRDPDAVNQLNPHLHNVPLQIAAERGLPALAIWLWFIVALVRDFSVKRRRAADPVARERRRSPSVGAMLAAGHVRIQFRRLRVPDAVPRPGDAALRRRSRAGRPPPSAMPRRAD